MATVTKTIGTTGRDYSTLTAWEADWDNDTPYDAADDVVGEVYNDSVFDELMQPTGGQTLGINSAKLTVPSSERHDGTAGTGARLVASGATKGISAKVTAVTDQTYEWFEVDGGDFDPHSQDGVLEISAPNTSHVVHHCIVHDVAGTRCAGIGFGDQSGCNALAHNNIVYNIDGGSSWSTGIWCNSGGTSDIKYYNNTTFNVTNTGGNGRGQQNYGAAGGTKELKNGISMNCDEDYLTQNMDAEDYNMSSDTTAAGANSLTSKTAANQFVSIVEGSEDFHLKAGADALDVGVDLGITPSGVEIDIDGRNRDAEGDTWDMGAHEFVVTGINVSATLTAALSLALTNTLDWAPSITLSPALSFSPTAQQIFNMSLNEKVSFNISEQAVYNPSVELRKALFIEITSITGGVEEALGSYEPTWRRRRRMH